MLQVKVDGVMYQASVVAVAAVAVLVSILLQDLDPQMQNGFPRIATPDLSHFPQKTGSYTRRVLNFYSQGVKCEGWKYTPTDLDPKFRDTIVIIGHGIGCQRDFGLHLYADGYAKAGV
jgi:hypothetical protein